jgi:hypothetical protein
VLIAVLLFTETTLAKLADHRITPEEVRQVNEGDRIVIRNPRPRGIGADDRPHPRRPDPDGCPQPGAGRRERMARSDGVGCQPGADQPLPTRPLVEHDVAVQHDDEITSDELDRLIDETETLSVERPAAGTEVRLYVAVDPDTLQELEQRAAEQGAELTDVAAEALRAGARAA